MPKIDWFDTSDDEPRFAPRARRERGKADPLDRRARLERFIALAASMQTQPPVDQPIKRPLHLIWGAPIPRPAREADGGSP